MTQKYIHYCWFGDKPLPKLAKKCIKSWKKYLPDYQIIKWSEENVDLNECPFIKEAYENKKWAFVADYVRTKAMYEYGGIYFDTDMEIIKNIDFLLKKETFLGVEDSGFIACGVWGEKNPKSYLPKKMLEFYKSLPNFDIEKLYDLSIPKVISNILDDFDIDNKEIQKLSHNIYIYPRDYFYPYSYNRDNNLFTENTCMIHYYDASWVPKWEQRENKIIRKYGKEKGNKIIQNRKKRNKIIKKIVKVPLFPLVLYRRNKKTKERISDFKTNFEKIKNNGYVTIYNPSWLGTTTSTKELFDSTLPLPETNREGEIEIISSILANSNLKLIIFSAFSTSWKKLIENIKKINPKVRIKILWHGSNAMHIEDYDWDVFNQMFGLLKTEKIESIGFVKKSMYELYKSKGYNVEFVMNNITLPDDLKNTKKQKNKNTKIGLYASGDRWVKNFYNQLAGASLIDNAYIDCVPLSPKTVEFASLLNTTLNGVYTQIPREELLKRMSMNDINLYITFVECAPLIPLESLEMGVPCITGNNHHYWENTELEEYLVVNKTDNAMEIYNKIKYCLDNKEKIIKLYKKWKKEYDKEVEKNISEFIEL